jgi:L-ascorbate metabolism protein UlaG (beta-lactamase superfamily)
MGGKAAAIAMKRFVKPKLAVPCHYGSFGIIDQTPDLFLAEMTGSDIAVRAPKVGEAFAV